jgi:hypothetical protein
MAVRRKIESPKSEAALTLGRRPLKRREGPLGKPEYP